MIRAIVGDLASTEADAVVRPTSTTLAPISATLHGIEIAAAADLPAPRSGGTELAVGSAIVTGARGLSADFIIHAVITGSSEPASPTSVRRAMLSSLQRATDWQFASVAFPPVGAGPGQLVMETTADIMAQVLIGYLKEQPFPADVLIVVSREEDKTIFEARLPVSMP